MIFFLNWFKFTSIIGKDWPFFFRETLLDFNFWLYSWSENLQSGLGSSVLSVFWIETYLRLPIALFVNKLGISWAIIEKIFWFWPFLLISFLASIYLYRTVFPKNKFWFLAPLIYLANTYILMMVGGGQMGVALGYAIAPLVLAMFIKIINQLTSLRVKELKSLIIAGLVLAIQVMFDLRIAYVTLIGVVVYYFINWLISWRVNKLRNKKNGWMAKWLDGWRNFPAVFFIPALIILGLHFYWILPLLVMVKDGGSPIGNLGAVYTTAGAVKYFSFAKFSQTISLLHPLWPENVFGMAHLMKPEFLILPLLAFSSLLFVNSVHELKSSRVKELRNEKNGLMVKMAKWPNGHILFFAFLGLIGAFLAKGSNPPFGGVYLWLFEHLPGMIMFRDASKFYTLIAISYSVLIPYSLERMVRWLDY